MLNISMKTFLEWLIEARVANYQNYGVPHYAKRTTPAIRGPNDDAITPSQPRRQPNSAMQIGSRFRFTPKSGHYKMFGDTEGTITGISGSNVIYQMDSETRKRNTSHSSFSTQWGKVEFVGDSPEVRQSQQMMQVQQAQDLGLKRQQKTDLKAKRQRQFDRDKVVSYLKSLMRQSLGVREISLQRKNYEAVGETISSSPSIQNYVNQYDEKRTRVSKEDMQKILNDLISQVVRRGKFAKTYK